MTRRVEVNADPALCIDGNRIKFDHLSLDGHSSTLQTHHCQDSFGKTPPCMLLKKSNSPADICFVEIGSFSTLNFKKDHPVTTVKKVDSPDDNIRY